MKLNSDAATIVTHCKTCGAEVELSTNAAAYSARGILCKACMREPKQKRMTPELYAEYLQTEHWQSFRKKILAKRGNRCQVCGRAGYVSIHHNNYERPWNEQESDVIVLCESDGNHYGCHQIFHDNGRLAY